MQRAAASTSSPSSIASSPLPPSSPQDPNGRPAKQQKLFYSVSQSPDPNALTPRSFYSSDDTRTPLPQARNQSFTPQSYGGNAAETPWVLSTPRSTGTLDIPVSPSGDTSPPDAVVGRRTFGNFKKRTPGKAAAKNEQKEGDESLSSADSEDDYEQPSTRTNGRATQNGEKSKGKRRQNPDEYMMDKINLKKLKSGGISAVSGLRQGGYDGRKYRKDKRKG